MLLHKAAFVLFKATDGKAVWTRSTKGLASPKLPSKWSNNLYHCSVYSRRPTLDSLLAIIYVINTWPWQRRAEWLRIRGRRRKFNFSSKILSLPYLKVSPQSCMKDGQQCDHTAISCLPYEKLRLSTGRQMLSYLWCQGLVSIWTLLQFDSQIQTWV